MTVPVALLLAAATTSQPKLSFVKDIVPIFTKAGCANSNCHGSIRGAWRSGRGRVLHHDQCGKQLADLVGKLRVPIDVFADGGSFSAAEALDELFSQLTPEFHPGFGIGHGGPLLSLRKRRCGRSGNDTGRQRGGWPRQM